MEAFDRPEDFWRLAKMLRRRIISRTMVVDGKLAENVEESEAA